MEIYICILIFLLTIEVIGNLKYLLDGRETVRTPKDFIVSIFFNTILSIAGINILILN